MVSQTHHVHLGASQIFFCLWCIELLQADAAKLAKTLASRDQKANTSPTKGLLTSPGQTPD